MEKSLLNKLHPHKPDPAFVDQLRERLVSSAASKDRTGKPAILVLLFTLLLLGFVFYYFSQEKNRQ